LKDKRKTIKTSMRVVGNKVEQLKIYRVIGAGQRIVGWEVKT
jgi:hypothetical protein